MTVEQVATAMYVNEENQLICLEDAMENVLYIGTLGDLRRNYPKSLNAYINTMYTERYNAFGGQSGLTIVINRKDEA